MDLRERIREAINCASAENGSNTPDFILAEYLMDCLKAFDRATRARTEHMAVPELAKHAHQQLPIMVRVPYGGRSCRMLRHMGWVQHSIAFAPPDSALQMAWLVPTASKMQHPNWIVLNLNTLEELKMTDDVRLSIDERSPLGLMLRGTPWAYVTPGGVVNGRLLLEYSTALAKANGAKARQARRARKR